MAILDFGQNLIARNSGVVSRRRDEVEDFGDSSGKSGTAVRRQRAR